MRPRTLAPGALRSEVVIQAAVDRVLPAPCSKRVMLDRLRRLGLAMTANGREATTGQLRGSKS